MSNQPLHCNYAWGHLDFHTKGYYTPCFRFDPNQQAMKKVEECLPSEAMNSEEMKAVRQQLSRGEWPTGCFECKNKESKGIRSYRQESIMRNVTWEGFNPDYTDVNINKYHEIEIKFSRTCNLFCRHCNTLSNSRFEILGKKFPNLQKEFEEVDFTHLSPPKKHIAEVSDEVVDDLVQNIIPNVSRIMFGGGEPLYHLAHYKFLEKLINSPNVDTKQIILEYNTNLSMISFKKYKLADLWEQFKAVRVTVSVDGTNSLFNYFRQNADYAQMLKNVHNILRECTTVNHLTFVCTSTAYHAFYMDEIINTFTTELTGIRLEYNINTHFKLTFVHYPEALDMVNLDDNVKEFLISNIEKSFKPSNYPDIVRPTYEHAYNEFYTYLKNPKNKNVDFKKVAKLQDELHSVDAFKLVPRIAEYVYNDKLVWI